MQESLPTGSRRFSLAPRIQRIGQYSYHLRHLLGEGFSSKVYKGTNANNQSVAIKVINPENMKQVINIRLLESELRVLEIMKSKHHLENQENQENYEGEKETQKQKQCQNILQMHQIIKQAQYTYIITQICKTDLSKLIPSHGLPLKKIVNYISQILQGFAHLYKKQIIHRDLKPANLLINCNEKIKIADFGFAIKSSQARLQTKYNIGSPLYMAPEALKNNEYSHKSDIWAIGVIVYEMLTGDTPWRAESEEELYEKLETESIQEILQNYQNQNRKGKIPEKVKDLLKGTLQFCKKDRISAEDLIKMTDNFIENGQDKEKEREKEREKILYKQKEKQQKQKQMQIQKQKQLKQITTKNLLNIPQMNNNKARGTKYTKTQKFYKPSVTTAMVKKGRSNANGNEQFSCQQKQINDNIFNCQESEDKRRKVNQQQYMEKSQNIKKSINTQNTIETIQNTEDIQNFDNSQLTFSITLVQKQSYQQQSIAKTQVSETPTSSSCLPKLTSAQQKSITNNLVQYIHFCRLLYKTLIRIDQCIVQNFNPEPIQKLQQLRDPIFKQFCKIIVFYMYRVKNLANNNFLDLPKQHLEDYILSKQYKNLRKVCIQYIQKYSSSPQLKFIWLQREQPNLQISLNLTLSSIKLLWSQLCLKNHNQIILLQFLLYSGDCLQQQKNGKYLKMDRYKILDYVDTIPNPPGINRFKQVVKKAKRVQNK